jgi:hypothetical protein
MEQKDRHFSLDIENQQTNQAMSNKMTRNIQKQKFSLLTALWVTNTGCQQEY